MRNLFDNVESERSTFSFAQALSHRTRSHSPRTWMVLEIQTTNAPVNLRATTVSGHPPPTSRQPITFSPAPSNQPTTVSRRPPPTSRQPITFPPVPSDQPATTKNPDPSVNITTSRPIYNGKCGCESKDQSHSLPFFAAIYLTGTNLANRNTYSKLCAGVIVDEKHVLASRSCFLAFKATSVQDIDVVISNDFKFGKYYKNSIHIKGKLCSNPKFRSIAPAPLSINKLYRYYHDYSIIKLDDKIKFQENIQPVCLQPNRMRVVNTNCKLLELESKQALNDDEINPTSDGNLWQIPFTLDLNEKCPCDLLSPIRRNSKIFCVNRQERLTLRIGNLIEKTICLIFRIVSLVFGGGMHQRGQKGIVVCPESHDSCPTGIKWHVSGIYSFYWPKKFYFTDTVGEFSRVEGLINSC